MAKSLEKLLEEISVPEMEYSPDLEKTKNKTKRKSTTVDNVPEFVLPKTKAEVYEEAKGRLQQKTSAVSKRAKESKQNAETAAAAAVSPAVDTTAAITAATSATIVKPTRSATNFKNGEDVVNPVQDPDWVGGAEELVPFAWRLPLIADIARPNKYYRRAVRESRELLLPVVHNK